MTSNEPKKSHYAVDDTSKIRKKFKDAKGDVERMKREEHEYYEKQKDDILKAGQEDPKKAAKHVKAQAEEMRKEQQDEADRVMNELESAKKSFYGYMQTLAKALAETLQMLDWIRGWKADVLVTKGGPIQIYGKAFQSQEGILLVVKTPDGRVMHQGMSVTQEPMLDYAGIYTLALQTENTMDAERGLLLDGKSLNGHDGDASGILGADGRPLKQTTRTPATNGKAVRNNAGGKKTGSSEKLLAV